MRRRRKKRSWGPLRFQIQRRSKLPDAKKKNAPVALQRTMDGIQKNFGSIVIVDPKIHTRREDIALLMFDEGGYGEFNFLHWDKLRRNKKFNNRFLCIGETCQFWRDSSCARFSIYKQGEACRANKWRSPNYTVFCRVTIFEADNKRGWDFTWHEKQDKMCTRFKWFFKG